MPEKLLTTKTLSPPKKKTARKEPPPQAKKRKRVDPWYTNAREEPEERDGKNWLRDNGRDWLMGKEGKWTRTS